ncbi:hypothetical protein [Sphingomonas sp.]|uniref:hypothetical protein n=1 Tax=Sphingomonas sp. TaxID=28214 RepID=UPI002DD665C8|nr:hypothetical protein [Sphingomonas sp.]
MTDTTATFDTTAKIAATEEQSRLDRLTNTTAEERQAFVNKAQETLASAVHTAVDAVKANPRTAAAIAAGATAAVAGAAYGATRLGKTKSTTATTRKAPARRTAATKK